MEGTQMSADLADLADLAGVSALPRTRHDPAEEGRHLHPAALPRWRALLEFAWQDRLERITQLSLAFHDAADAAADPRGGQDARRAARQLARRLLHQTVIHRRALADTEAAPGRLATGRFGWCELCGKAIAIERLTQTPQTTYCAACG
jgi:DnaK suppressor protein